MIKKMADAVVTTLIYFALVLALLAAIRYLWAYVAVAP